MEIDLKITYAIVSMLIGLAVILVTGVAVWYGIDQEKRKE